MTSANTMDRTMAVVPRKYRDISPANGITKAVIQPNSRTERKKVAVLYFLSRNGQLEHPHFIEVPLSCPEGLYLRDVMEVLKVFRGEGMACMYSWSSKRRFKSGFVWQDLTDNDFIYPCHGHEYILKGSLVQGTSPGFRSCKTISSAAISNVSSPDRNSSSEDSNSPLINKVYYKVRSTGEFISKLGATVPSQTDDNARTVVEEDGVIIEHQGLGSVEEELSVGEASSPSMRSSPKVSVDESMERPIMEVSVPARKVRHQTFRNDRPSRRMKSSSSSSSSSSSTLLMKLIRCGSRRFTEF